MPESLSQLFFSGFADWRNQVSTPLLASDFSVGAQEPDTGSLRIDIAATEFGAVGEVGCDFDHDLVGLSLGEEGKAEEVHGFWG